MAVLRFPINYSVNIPAQTVNKKDGYTATQDSQSDFLG